MMNSHTSIATHEAARLIQRLCAHWGHKFTVKTESNLGRIDFGDSQCQLTGNDEHLRIDLHCPDQPTASRMQDVVFDHLQRMAKSQLSQPVWSSLHVG